MRHAVRRRRAPKRSGSEVGPTAELRRSRQRRIGAALLGALMLLALGLRLSHVQEYPLHEDEILSIDAMESIVESGLPKRVGGDFYWRSLLGHYLMAVPLLFMETDVFSARLVPAILSILLLPLAFLMGCSVESRWTGWLAALFLAFSAFQNFHAAFARFYMPFQFFYVASVYLSANYFLLRRPGAGPWLLIACIATIFTHRLAVELVPVLALALLLGRRIDLLRSWRFAGGAFLVGLALYLTHFGLVPRSGPGTTVPQVAGAMQDKWFFVKMFHTFAPVGWTLLILGLAPIVWDRERQVDRALWTFYLASFVGTLLAITLVSPWEILRYMCNAFPLGVLMAAASLVWWVKRIARWSKRPPAWSLSPASAAVGLIVGAGLLHAVAAENWQLSSGVGNYYTSLDQKPAHDALAQQLTPDDVLISMEPSLSRFYLGRSADFFLREKLDKKLGQFRPFRERKQHVIDSPARLEALLSASKERVWLYANYKISFTTSTEMHQVIARHFEPVYGYQEKSGSVLFLRDAPPTAESTAEAESGSSRG